MELKREQLTNLCRPFGPGMELIFALQAQRAGTIPLLVLLC